MQIQVVERTQQILVQEQEIIRKEKELDATVRRPAEAEKYRYKLMMSALYILSPVNLLIHELFFPPLKRLEKIAEAHRQRTVLEAQAQAEALRLQVIYSDLIV